MCFAELSLVVWWDLGLWGGVFLFNAGVDVHNASNRLRCAIQKAKGNCILTHLGHWLCAL